MRKTARRLWKGSGRLRRGFGAFLDVLEAVGASIVAKGVPCGLVRYCVWLALVVNPALVNSMAAVGVIVKSEG